MGKKYFRKEDGRIIEVTKSGNYVEEKEVSEDDFERKELMDAILNAVGYIFFFILFLVIVGVFSK